MSDLTAAIEAAKAVSEWLVYEAEDGENSIRRATTDEILERRITAAAPLIEASVRAKIAEELLAVDPVEWALAGQNAGLDAAVIARGHAVEAPSVDGASR